MLTVFLVMVSMGFVGSLHCVGMCGGLVSALSMSQPRVWWAGLAGYQVGRVTTYAVLGLGAGLLGGALSGMGSIVPRLLSLLAGVVMIAVGLHMAGWLPDPLTRFTNAARDRVGLIQLTTTATRRPTSRSWYAMGLANALLPCGLVYAALGLSLAAGDPLEASLMMLGFGMGTVPAMMFAPAIVRALTPESRGAAMRVMGLVVVVLGLLTVVRGGILYGSGIHHSHPAQVSAPAAP